MDKLTLFNEVIARLKAQSPELFNRLMKYSIYLILLIAIPLVLEWAEVIVLPGKLGTVLWAAITFFLGTGTTSALPVKTMDGPGGNPPPPGKPDPKG